MGGLITYAFNRYKDEKLKKDEAINLSYLIWFSLSTQYSVLAKLLREIGDRNKILQEMAKKKEELSKKVPFGGETFPEAKTISLIQEFNLCIDIPINYEHLGKVILPASKKHKEVIEILRDCFICNKKYADCLIPLNMFNKIKQNDKSDRPELIKFLKLNLPKLETQINSAMEFNKNTSNSFKEMVMQVLAEEITVDCHSYQ
jgi:hypothetical protein